MSTMYAGPLAGKVVGAALESKAGQAAIEATQKAEEKINEIAGKVLDKK